MCIDCQHNTTGRFCEACKERFYRESGKSLKSSDVCTPCACEGPGVQSGKLDCVKVSALPRRVGIVRSHCLILFLRDKGLWVQFSHGVSHCFLGIRCSVSDSVAYI